MSAPFVTRRLLGALRALVEPVAEGLGLRLVAVEVIGGEPTVLRVSVDRPGGSTIEDCTRLSRQLSPLLDEAEPLSSAYTLEVSTPGIDRPLQRPEDFAWFTGCSARVKLFGADSRRRLAGTLAGADDASVRIRVGDETHTIAFTDIERAHLVLDLDQYARLGEGLHPIEPEGAP